MNCVVCGRSATEFCEDCKKLKWEARVKLMLLHQISESLKEIERKLPDRNK